MNRGKKCFLSFDLEGMVEEEESAEESWPARSLEYSAGGEGMAPFSMKRTSFMMGPRIGSKQKNQSQDGLSSYAQFQGQARGVATF